MNNSNKSISKVDDSAEKGIASIELALLGVAKTSGIRTPPDVATLNELARFIIRYFGKLNMTEIKDAFDYAIANGVEHYGQMDKTFVARALNSWKANQPVKSVALQIEEGITNPRGGKESYLALLTFRNEHGTFPFVWDWSKAWEYMKENDLIPFDKEYKNNLHMKVIARQKAEILLNTNASEITIKKMIQDTNAGSESVIQQTIKEIVKEAIIANEKSNNQTIDGDAEQTAV